MKEADIRPQALFAVYLELSRRDAERMPHAAFVSVPCPACDADAPRPAFEKHGFSFARCGSCDTLYCSPRPSAEMLADFYRDSPSAQFWAREFFPAVAEVRRTKLFRPKAERLRAWLDDRGLHVTSICDVGAGAGVFLEELGRQFPGAKLSAIEPSVDLAAQCRAKGFDCLETTAAHAADWRARFDLVVSLEVLEHVFAPAAFLADMHALVRPGGTVLATGLGGDGFDILLLGEHSNSVSPPHHLNFLSVAGFTAAFRRARFTQVEVTTPGELDVDIVLQSGRAPRFLEVLAERPGAAAALQALLQEHRLSSHVWCFGRS